VRPRPPGPPFTRGGKESQPHRRSAVERNENTRLTTAPPVKRTTAGRYRPRVETAILNDGDDLPASWPMSHWGHMDVAGR
jgi:hypothetical protein